MRDRVHRGEVTFLAACLGDALLLTGCSDGVLRVFRVAQKEEKKKDGVSMDLLLQGMVYEEEEYEVCEDECVESISISDVCTVVLDDHKNGGILTASATTSMLAITTSSRLRLYSITPPFHLSLLSSFSIHEAPVTGLCFLVSFSHSLHSSLRTSYPSQKIQPCTSTLRTLLFFALSPSLLL